MPLLENTLIPALTAVFTVTLTIWLYQKRDKLNALRAIKSEAQQNKTTAGTIIEHINEDIELRENDRERIPSIPPLANNAYVNLKNTGVLAQLPSPTRNTITEHYSHIDYANHQLDYRQQLRSTSRALTNFSDMIGVLDPVIQKEMLLLGSVDLEVTEEAAENPNFEDALDEFTTFDEVIHAVENELENHPILTTII